MRPTHSLTPADRAKELTTLANTIAASSLQPTVTRWLEISREESIDLQREQPGNSLEHSAKTVLLTQMLVSIAPR